jgi:heme exporter protein CcmD
MRSLAEFFDMGGYAAFVWPAYLVTFAVIGLNVLWARRALARARVAAGRRLATQGESR